MNLSAVLIKAKVKGIWVRSMHIFDISSSKSDLTDVAAEMLQKFETNLEGQNVIPTVRVIREIPPEFATWIENQFEK